MITSGGIFPYLEAHPEVVRAARRPSALVDWLEEKFQPSGPMRFYDYERDQFGTYDPATDKITWEMPV